MQYLGLPQKKGRLIRLEWQPVIEKVERRLGGGKQSFVKGWVIGVAPLSTYNNPYFLSIYFQIAYRS